MRTIEFTSGDERMHARIHLPEHGERVPAVLMIPGFADTATGIHNMHIRAARELCSAGFAVMRFDYRGLGESEGDFSRFTVRSGLDDAREALQALRSETRIDPERIGIFGFSLGGALAVRLAAECRSVKALALWAPVAYMSPVFNSFFTEDHRRQAVEKGWMDWMGWPVGECYLRTVAEIDPLAAYRQARIPSVVIHGTADTEVPLANAEAYIKEGAAIRWLEGGDHLFSSVVLQDSAAAYTRDWFIEFL